MKRVIIFVIIVLLFYGCSKKETTTKERDLNIEKKLTIENIKPIKTELNNKIYFRAVAVKGNFLFVAMDRDGIYIYENIDDKFNLIKVIDTRNSCLNIKIYGNLAFAMISDLGVIILDVSEPINTKVIATVEASGLGKNIFVSGKYAYLADMSNGMQIIDISEPKLASIVQYKDFYRVNDIYVIDNKAYVLDQSKGFYIVNISKINFIFTEKTVYTGGSPRRIIIKGKYAYIADYNGSIKIYDISNIKDTPLVSAVKIDGYPKDIALSGNYLYVAAFVGGVSVIDITKPEEPFIKDTLSDRRAESVSLYKDSIIVTDTISGLYFIKFRDGKLSYGQKIENTSSIIGVRYYDQRIFTYDKRGNILVYDLTTVKEPDLIKKLSTSRVINSIGISAHTLICSSDLGLSYIDLSEIFKAGHPKLKNTDTIVCDAMVIYGRDVFAAHENNIDKYYKEEAALVFETNIIANASMIQALALDKERLVFADDKGRFGIYNISTNDSVEFKRVFDTELKPYKIILLKNYIFSADRESFIEVININENKNILSKSISLLDPATDMRVYENKLFVATGKHGIQVIDIENPKSAKVVQTIDRENSIYSIDISDKYIFTAEGDKGIAILGNPEEGY